MYVRIMYALPTAAFLISQEDYVRYCAKYALEHCADDLHYFENEYPAGEKGSH